MRGRLIPQGLTSLQHMKGADYGVWIMWAQTHQNRREEPLSVTNTVQINKEIRGEGGEEQRW